MNITLDDTSPQWRFTSATNGWLLNHTDDTQTKNYFGSTFHGTFTDGDTVSLTFNGTAVTIYGAFRPNHGVYSAQLDNNDILYQLGYASPSKMQQVLYSQGGLSSDQEHTVTLVNLPSHTSPAGNATIQWWLDIDYAVITTAETGKIYTTRYDDTSTFVTYTGSGWTPGPPLEPQLYYNTTAHITPTVGDSFSLKFNGSSIQVFGGLYYDHGNYTVSLDGNAMANYNGSWFELAASTSLFTATNLTDGPHEVVFTNIGKGVLGSFFDFDYAIVNSTIDPAGGTGNSTGTGTDTGESTVTSGAASSSSTSGGASTTSVKKSNAGAIAGGVVGGLAALALLGLLVWWWMRRRRERDNGYGDDNRAAPVDFNGEEVKPYTHPNNDNNSSAGDAYLAASGYSNTDSQHYSTNVSAGHPSSVSTGTAGASNSIRHQPPMLSVPPPPASNATSYPHSINPPSSASSPSPITEGVEYPNPFTGGSNSTRESSNSSGFAQQQRQLGGGLFTPTPIPGISSVGTGSTGASSTAATEPPQTPPPVPTTRTGGKAAGVGLPFTARRPMGDSGDYSSLDGRSILTGRLQRDGREMDMGPVGALETLPPDYQQATEPLPGQRHSQNA